MNLRQNRDSQRTPSLWHKQEWRDRRRFILIAAGIAGFFILLIIFILLILTLNTPLPDLSRTATLSATPTVTPTETWTPTPTLTPTATPIPVLSFDTPFQVGNFRVELRAFQQQPAVLLLEDDTVSAVPPAAGSKFLVLDLEATNTSADAALLCLPAAQVRLRSTRGEYRLTGAGSSVTDAGSLLTLRQENNRIVSGNVWLHASGRVFVRTPQEGADQSGVFGVTGPVIAESNDRWRTGSIPPSERVSLSLLFETSSSDVLLLVDQAIIIDLPPPQVVSQSDQLPDFRLELAADEYSQLDGRTGQCQD